jgi:hypothetical protein
MSYILAYAANAVGKDLDIFAVRAVSLSHIELNWIELYKLPCFYILFVCILLYFTRTHVIGLRFVILYENKY